MELNMNVDAQTLRGSYVALVTPFRNGAIDTTALTQLVQWHVKEGTQGIVVLGTTGEAATVSESEYKIVVQCAVDAAQQTIPIIAGATSNNPTTAIHYANIASQYGANAVLSAAGFYTKPNQAGLHAHFKLLHDETDLPIVIYNIPPRTSVDIEPETLASLARLERIIGVKDATKDISHISLERSLINKPFAYFSGDDLAAPAYNAHGGHGCISVTANVVPHICAQLQNACERGDFYSALEIHDALVPLHNALFLEPSPAGIKYAMSLIDKCDEFSRPPIMPLLESSQLAIKEALTRLV
jgi:4-hydroxy-tetrahydrodipicolinate synthase